MKHNWTNSGAFVHEIPVLPQVFSPTYPTAPVGNYLASSPARGVRKRDSYHQMQDWTKWQLRPIPLLKSLGLHESYQEGSSSESTKKYGSNEVHNQLKYF